MKIFAVNIRKIEEFNLNHMLTFVSKNRIDKVNKFLRYEDKVRSLIAEILIRVIVHEELGIRNSQIKFSTNSFGKLFLNNCKDFYFNISHSNDWIVCISANCHVGIDIEKIEPIDYLSISKNYFTNKEYEYISQSSCNQQLENFYRIWTLKESYVKALGYGLNLDTRSFSISINKYNDIKLRNRNNYNFKEINIDKEYKTSICYFGNLFKSSTKVIVHEELISIFENMIL